MSWLCYVKHNWFFIDGFNRRTCLRCKKYQRLSVWRSVWGNEEVFWLDEVAK